MAYLKNGSVRASGAPLLIRSICFGKLHSCCACLIDKKGSLPASCRQWNAAGEKGKEEKEEGM
eukprot:scaffold219752_cov14-Tisochrysis_lutea.AAC.1